MAATASVLIAEDDLEISESFEDALAARGHRVLVAHNGREALDTLDLLSRPALVFLDLFMPVVDGLGFLNGLKSRADRADFEVVVMSAVVNVEWFSHVPGVLRALKKPMDVTEVVKIADEFAATRRASGSPTGAEADAAATSVAGRQDPAPAGEERKPQ